MPKALKTATTCKQKVASVPNAMGASAESSRKPPKIEWAKHPDWTWTLITYLTDHSIFRTKLFFNSTADAAASKREAHKGSSKGREIISIISIWGLHQTHL